MTQKDWVFAQNWVESARNWIWAYGGCRLGGFEYPIDTLRGAAALSGNYIWRERMRYCRNLNGLVR